MTLRKLFAQLEGIRSNVSIPLILMGYLNPIMQFGFEAFCRRCVEVGVDGVIIPDLPFKDYLEDYKPVADRYDIRIIMLITPETSDERIRFIDDNTDGFIYMVSSAAITGAQQEFNDAKQAYFSRINSMGLKHPRMIGFGISNKQTKEAAESKEFSDMTEKALRILRNADSMPVYELTDEIKMLSAEKSNLNDYLDLFQFWFRDVLMFKATAEMNHLVFKQEINYIREQARERSYENIEKILMTLHQTKTRLRANVNMELALELLLLAIREK